MHAHLLNSEDVDANLYPALLQVFTIILLGYFAGILKIVNSEQATGLNLFVGTFILPALLLKVKTRT
jgi:predicted permease